MNATVKILATISELRQFAAATDLLNPDISKWSVGMQIEHLCLAMKRICTGLVESTPPAPANKSSSFKGFLRKKVIFFAGRLPRGVGRAPEQTIPAKQPTSTELEKLLNECTEIVESASKLSPEHWFKHHVFGVLKRDAALRFIQIHNRHHLLIIREIRLSGRKLT
ncbi:DinB family protein [bacterium]|nr:DinB family protein [bacterium]